jgi:FkbM family methyltransferase
LSAQPPGDLSPPVRRSLTRRLLSSALHALRATGIPGVERLETGARRAVGAVSSGLERVRPTRHALERLERRIERLEQRAIETGRGSVDIARLVADTKAGVDSLRFRNVFPIGSDTLVVRNPDGYLCIPAEDYRLVGHLADGVPDEPGTARVIQTLLAPGATFLDIGANVGMFTLMAARMVGPSGKVIALEPIPRLVALLRKTIVMDDIERIVEVHEVAASDVATTRTLNIGYPYAVSSLYDLPGSRAAIDVACVPVDDLLGPGRKVDLVKIDVEGAELAVLRGMRRVLAENPQVVVIVEFGPSSIKRTGTAIDAWMRELQTLGFDIWEIDDEKRCLRRLRKASLEGDRTVNLALARGRSGRLQSLIQDDLP